MKTLKVLLQEVVSGIKAWVNSNFAQESNTVHKTGNETVNGNKTFSTDVRSNTRFEHRDTVISSKESPSSERKTDTFSHIGGDGTFWGGLKHCWYASGNSATQICVANHKLNGSTWTQGFWAINFGVSKDFSSVYFAPTTNNGINLGTANYQWNNVYAKNYFYNGTAWGLDKGNIWSGHNRFYKNAALSSISTWSDPTMAFSATFNTILFNTRGSTNFPSYGTFLYAGYESTLSPVKFGVLKLVRSTDKKGDTNDGLIPDTSFNMMTISPHYLRMDIMESVKIQNDGSVNQMIPLTNNVTDLGTSTYKWKSFNGVNPGALSLPQAATNFEDLTGYVLDGVTENRFPISGVTALDGWLQCRVKHTLGTVSFLRIGMPYRVWTAQDKDCVEEYVLWVPVKAGVSFDKVICLADDLKIRFHPCLGNV